MFSSNNFVLTNKCTVEVTKCFEDILYIQRFDETNELSNVVHVTCVPPLLIMSRINYLNSILKIKKYGSTSNLGIRQVQMAYCT